jgi:protein-S-isoprenylcysteine O-methyltransferase Ste14
LAAAAEVDLTHPDRLVTSGPYAVSRNPMYGGWALLHLGAGVTGGSVWIIASFPIAAWAMHRGVMREERALVEKFADEFGRYRAAVPRYLPSVEVVRRRGGRLLRIRDLSGAAAFAHE